MLTVASMLATGTTTNSMGSEKKNGTTALNIRDSTKMHRKRVKESTAGLTETDMLENGQIICSMAKDFSSGMMTGFTSETGKII